MRNFFYRLMGELQRFMYGRNGNDQLNVFILVLYFIVAMLESLLRVRSFTVNLAQTALLLIYIFRTFSKNLSRRRDENQKFLSMYFPAKRWCKTKITRLKKMKQYHYFKCPNCKSELRVPRGKGNISVTCPKCRATFDKKS